LDRTSGLLLDQQAFDRLAKGGEGLGSFDREPLNGFIGLCFAEEKTRRGSHPSGRVSFNVVLGCRGIAALRQAALKGERL
jgi:hypothetical protein